jgi:hypothetical protein
LDHHLGSNIQAVAATVVEGGGLDIQLAYPSSLMFHIPIQEDTIARLKTFNFIDSCIIVLICPIHDIK